MLTGEQNDLLTQTGPGTPGGDYMRRYWWPVALAEELPPGGAPLPVRLLGEELVLFRDDAGRPGLLGLHCSHRGVDLSYGRCEDGGLRCLYHGWLYDVAGRCLEQPGEPADSTFKDRIRHTAYPCRDVGGLILTYLGPGEPPLVPGYEFLHVPEEQRWATKLYHEANYLQGVEANIDPIHVTNLHRLEPEAARRLEQVQQQGNAVRGTNASRFALYSSDKAPLFDLEEAEFGMRIIVCFAPNPEQYFVRVSNFILPTLGNFGSSTGAEGYSVHWVVPIDDGHHWLYRVDFNRVRAVNKEALARQTEAEITPDYRFRRNAANRYGQDREEQRTSTFTGMGTYFQVHDAFAIESPGPVLDRTVEHLGGSDRAVTKARQILLRAIEQVQAGDEAPHVARVEADRQSSDPVVISEIVPSTEDWRGYWRRPTATGRAAEPVSS
jgi:nitrite reductase/ring-hydroxylating ferredoxin subunit